MQEPAKDLELRNKVCALCARAYACVWCVCGAHESECARA